jgi:hypothetical protein
MDDATTAGRARALLDRDKRRLLTLALLHENHAEHLRERAYDGQWLKKHDDCALCVCERPWRGLTEA